MKEKLGLMNEPNATWQLMPNSKTGWGISENPETPRTEMQTVLGVEEPTREWMRL